MGCNEWWVGKPTEYHLIFKQGWLTGVVKETRILSQARVNGHWSLAVRLEILQVPKPTPSLVDGLLE